MRSAPPARRRPNDRSGAPRAEVFGRIEAERTDHTHRAGLPRGAVFRRILGADRLGGVLDHGEGEAPGNLIDRIHLAAQTEKVHRNNRPNDSTSRIEQLVRFIFVATVFQKIRDGRRRDVQSDRIDINQDGGSAQPRDAAGGRKKGVAGRDYGVVRPDLQRHQDVEQRVGSRRDADRVPGAAVVRQRALKFLHLRAQDETLRPQDLVELTAIGSAAAGMFAQVEQRYAPSATEAWLTALGAVETVSEMIVSSR